MPSPLAALIALKPPHQSTDEMEMNDSPEEEKTENSISIPDGLKTPEGHKDGDAFQGTFRGFIKDGKLCFRSINNIPLEKSEDDESQEEEASESPEEEANEEKMGMDKEPSPVEDEEDKKWKMKQRDKKAFSAAFHG